MTSRIERPAAAFKRDALGRRRKGFAPLTDVPNPDLALVYSNGYVTVEVSQEALEAFIDLTGDVPLPLVIDPETGDRRTYDARNEVSVVHDARSRLREVCKRSDDGLFVRINFVDDDESDR